MRVPLNITFHHISTNGLNISQDIHPGAVQIQISSDMLQKKNPTFSLVMDKDAPKYRPTLLVSTAVNTPLLQQQSMHVLVMCANQNYHNTSL